MPEPQLDAVMYHYVRDLPRTDFPRIKGMLPDDFRRQVNWLSENYEMASLESALAFLRGEYQPKRSLCLLTFDDCLKEHYVEVTPLLAEHGIQGIFFVITSCLQEHRVASAHMNHFLMAALDFNFYRDAFLKKLQSVTPAPVSPAEIGEEAARRTYRWDTSEVRSFKYLFNFVLDPAIRDKVAKELFEEHIGAESEFSRALYFNWDEAKQMQKAGMTLGGHSHRHLSLATLTDEARAEDLKSCYGLLMENLLPQSLWPFSYPYGKQSSFNQVTVQQLNQIGFSCSFATEVGTNRPGADLFAINRIDCNDVQC
jgi:peptidoglycan/xylan/chitin deacetylase (PgdA/CDA1 family)